MSRYRLLPTSAQQGALREHCGHARYVWNLAVEQHLHWRPGRASGPGYLEQCRQLTAARAEHPWRDRIRGPVHWGPAACSQPDGTGSGGACGVWNESSPGGAAAVLGVWAHRSGVAREPSALRLHGLRLRLPR